jgi:hypothetical protein
MNLIYPTKKTTARLRFNNLINYTVQFEELENCYVWFMLLNLNLKKLIFTLYNLELLSLLKMTTPYNHSL